MNRVLARYLLFQIPGMGLAGIALWLLADWGIVTPRLAWGLFALWLLKDVVLYPMTRIAYGHQRGPHGAEALVGASGVAQQALEPGGAGYVRVGAELWKARLDADAPSHGVASGDLVRVTAVRDLTLLVVPESR